MIYAACSSLYATKSGQQKLNVAGNFWQFVGKDREMEGESCE